MSMVTNIRSEIDNLEDDDLDIVSELAFDGYNEGSEYCNGFNDALCLLAGLGDLEEILDTLKHRATQAGVDVSAIVTPQPIEG